MTDPRATSPAPDRRRCVLASGHKGRHVAATHKPIFDRMKDGEFSHDEYPDGFAVPGVSVPANVRRCRGLDKRV